MSAQELQYFDEVYGRKAKSERQASIRALSGLHWGYLEMWAVQFLFWLLAAGALAAVAYGESALYGTSLGIMFMFWFIGIIKAKSLCQDCNKDIARAIAQEASVHAANLRSKEAREPSTSPEMVPDSNEVRTCPNCGGGDLEFSPRGDAKCRSCGKWL